MNWHTWLPWRKAITKLARSQGFIDPIAVYSRFQRFLQPSEVAEPIELIRAGVILQARGLINTRAIQHNLDWVWPYWISRQFNPRDISFIPRGFSFTHVNLTHRNWTAVGMPDCAQMPLVDPRGLLTPLFDGWSLDAWIVQADGPPLLPSVADEASQRMVHGDTLGVETTTQRDGLALRSKADVVQANGVPTCRLDVEGLSPHEAWLVLSVRPVNTEGIAFVDSIEVEPSETGSALRINGEDVIRLRDEPDRVAMSSYWQGDVFRDLPQAAGRSSIECDVGLATAAAVYPMQPGSSTSVAAEVPLTGPSAHPEPGLKRRRAPRASAGERLTTWEEALDGTCAIQVPDEQIEFLFRNALRNLVLFSPDEVYPGPFSSKRFWFRDAAFIVNAMCTVGLTERADRVLHHYPQRQQLNGFFRSQEGEWDANGQAIWVLDRFRSLTGRDLSDELTQAVKKGVRWIRRKRLPDSAKEVHAGLLPPGFSAEHLGPNDYFYWDDFWSAAGLRAGARLLDRVGETAEADAAAEDAEALLRAVDRSLHRTAGLRRYPGVPASPYRRMDAGAIGSLAASYPTQVWSERDPRMLATAEYILANCTVAGGFFQDVIHSGVNAYLTLHLAEVFLRAGDRRHEELVRTLAGLASPTGNWPEAIHPRTRGGCMGDGQHIWAASEWVLMMRNWFVREENDRLILLSGVPDDWVSADTPLRFGPTETPYGPITVNVTADGEEAQVHWEAEWRNEAPPVELRLGHASETVPGEQHHARISRVAHTGIES